MGFQDDWIMRQIEVITRFVAQVVFNKNKITYETDTTSEMLSETDRIHLELDRLIREKKLCEAEDMLFENIEFSDRYVELAADFYTKLNMLSDDELAAGDFSRDEVYDGYIDILTQLGIPVEQFIA